MVDASGVGMGERAGASSRRSGERPERMAEARTGCRIGIDVGGTFTDFVLTNPRDGRDRPLQGAERSGRPVPLGGAGAARAHRAGRGAAGRRRASRPRHDPPRERDHRAPRRQGRSRRLAGASRGPRDRPHEPRQFVRLHPPQGRTPGAAEPRVRDGRPGARGRERRGASERGGPRPACIRPAGGRGRSGHRPPHQLLCLPRDGARRGASAPAPPARGPGHRVGRDLAGAARVRARARRHHERVRAAAHERLPEPAGGARGRGGGRGADLHHRLERGHAQHRHGPRTAG